MGKSLNMLKEDRYHVQYVLANVELTEQVRHIFVALLMQIEEQIRAVEKPN
jgi:hypothetical protein